MQLRSIKLIALIIILCGVSFAQDIDPSDAAAIRTLIAEKQALQKENTELTKQVSAWQEQAANWQKLYESEKQRADVVQGERIEQLRTAYIETDKANALLKQQIEFDKDYIGRLESRIKSLKRQRLYMGVVGFGAGVAVGGRIRF